ncbi:hypothetical protein [Pseudomonas mediterranea]
MSDTILIDPATLSGTELLLRKKYQPDSLATTPSESATGVAGKEGLSVYKGVASVAPNSPEELAEWIRLKLQADKIVELAKKAKRGS